MCSHWTLYRCWPRRVWLLTLTAISAVWGVLRRNRLVILTLAWFVILLAIGLAYLTGLRLLEVTNMGAVLMMWYLPIALIIGAAAAELNKWLAARQRARAAPAILAVALLAGFVGSHSEVMKVEDYRYFMTPADEAAMNWIRANTPPRRALCHQHALLAAARGDGHGWRILDSVLYRAADYSKRHAFQGRHGRVSSRDRTHVGSGPTCRRGFGGAGRTSCSRCRLCVYRREGKFRWSRT